MSQAKSKKPKRVAAIVIGGLAGAGVVSMIMFGTPHFADDSAGPEQNNAAIMPPNSVPLPNESVDEKCADGQENELYVYDRLNDYLPREQANRDVELYEQYRYNPNYFGDNDKPDVHFSCMTVDEIVPVVQAALPKYHAEIDERNAAVDAHAAPLRTLQGITNDHDRMVEAVKASCEYSQDSGYSSPNYEYPSSQYNPPRPPRVPRDNAPESNTETYVSTPLVDATPVSVRNWLRTLRPGVVPEAEINAMPVYGKHGSAQVASYSTIEDVYGEAWKKAFPVGKLPDPAFPRDMSLVAAPVCGVRN